MKNKEEPRMKWSDDEYEAMIDLATRQLAERMAERALMTYEIYKYDYLGRSLWPILLQSLSLVLIVHI
ncbi:MAG: hypothetical protein ACTHVD_03650 [Lactococcus lactis]